ncbi:MAG: hypothetical protein PARBA_01821 [Parabacteroides sp.]
MTKTNPQIPLRVLLKILLLYTAVFYRQPRVGTRTGASHSAGMRKQDIAPFYTSAGMRSYKIAQQASSAHQRMHKKAQKTPPHPCETTK